MIFLFDANFPVQLGRALKELSRAPHEFKHVDLEADLGRGAGDEAVIEAAGREGWFLVSLDKGIVKNPAKRRLLFEKGVGTFSFTGSAIGNWSYYETVSFVMAIAEEMFELATQTPAPLHLWNYRQEEIQSAQRRRLAAKSCGSSPEHHSKG